MEPIINTCTMQKDTGNTITYSPDPKTGEPPRIRIVYVEKWALPDGGERPPKKVRITIEEVE